MNLRRGAAVGSRMNTLGWLHTGCAVVALLTGAMVLLRPKGTAAHRRLGWAYAGSMLGLNVTALLIYRLFGGVRSGGVR